MGRPATFVLAVTIIVGWAIAGPFYGFSDGWSLWVNTATTIVSFLMLFLVQGSQNRDGAAIQRKLDALIRAADKAPNWLIGLERRSSDEVAATEIRADDDV